ncbi:MAG: HAD family phosphatase [Eubacterium sp.]|nr:HAD family phosphatase [Eubacterium sp.]
MINFNQYQAAIFDFDGTLVDSMGLWHQIDIQYLGKRNITCPPDLSRHIAGMSFSETAQYVKNRFQLPEDIDAIQREWIAMSHHIYLSDIAFKPGALEFIKKLKAAGMPLAIATSNNRMTTEAYLDQHQLLQDFGALCFTGEVGVGKPDPAVFLAAARALGVSPEACIVFEDTFEGLTGAKNAAMTAVAVADSFQDAQRVKSIADFYTEDFISFERL